MTTDNPNSTLNTNNPGDRAADNRPRRAGVAGRVLGYVPTLLVFAVLGGIAYWGHHTGWKAPKFSQLAGAESVAEREDWCVEHNVPDSRCIKCHPELVGANMNDWCPEHGLPESKCTICHPEILSTGVAGDWCPEHGLPESSCTLCHPEIAVKGALPASAGTGATVTLISTDALPTTAPVRKEHDEHEEHDEHGEHADAHGEVEHAGHDHGDPATSGGSEAAHEHTKDPKTCQTHAMRVQFASGDSVRKAGVQLGQVTERPMSATLTANAEVQYDRNRYAQVSSPVAGKVWRVEKEIGEAVRKGDVIALVDAAEVGRAKAEFLQAVAEQDLKVQTLERLKASTESGFRTAAELQEAEAAVRAADIGVFNARQALINLGLSEAGEEALARAPERQSVQFMGLPKALAETLDPRTTTASLLPLVATFDGTVIEQNVVAGAVIEPSEALFVVADTKRMWVTADVPLADARRLALGRSITFRPDGARDEPATGKITWISTAVDDQTRTVKVRADVENPDGQLLAHTFGKATITIRQSPTAIAVPSEAIQWEGCCNIAFVRLTDDIFQTRKVKLGAKVNGFTEVLIGLLPGEVVATEGSHVLKSEILKSALGAGCAEHGH